jgi:metallo-beta-lactamase family protein
LIQGSAEDEARNHDPFPFPVSMIDAVILSHAHIDHSGRLPLLYRAGYRGPIYSHRACRDLCRIMLKDAGFLNEKDAEWDNRKRLRRGLEPRPPLYGVEDAQQVMHQFKGLDYGQRKRILPGVTLELADAGHILGSAIVRLWLEERGEQRQLVFSGDLGHRDAPVLRDPTPVKEADLVLLESTYGDRLHRSRQQTLEELDQVIGAARHARGNLLIPAFAVGRTQEILYLLSRNYEAWDVGKWQIFLDSPMAIQATEVYLRHSQLFDEEALALWKRNRSQALLPNLHFSRTSSQSMKINRIQSGAMIIAGSGMCTGGRIRHHLKHNIWRRDCHVVIVGFQARGTTGRALVDGAEYIRLWGEKIKVAAQIHTVGGLSAHADQQGLIDWYSGFQHRPPVALVHGEPEAAEALAQRLREDVQARVQIPRRGEKMDLLTP